MLGNAQSGRARNARAATAFGGRFCRHEPFHFSVSSRTDTAADTLFSDLRFSFPRAGRAATLLLTLAALLVFAPDRVCPNDGSGNLSCSDVSTDAGGSFCTVAADFDGDGTTDLAFAGGSLFLGGANRVCYDDGSVGFSCSCFFSSDGTTFAEG